MQLIQYFFLLAKAFSNNLMEGYQKRMGHGGGIPGKAAALPPLPPSHLRKLSASGGEKLSNWTNHTFHMNLNVHGNGKNIFSDGEATAAQPLKQEIAADADNDPNSEAKRLRRVMQSRQYSQKYRLKQLHYITQLESELKALQAEVTITSPRIKFMDRQNSLLRAENHSIKEKLSVYTGERLFKEAQYEELKRERNMLKEIYEAYQLKLLETIKSNNININNNTSAAGGSTNYHEMVENCPQIPNKSNPFSMLEN